jgi:hypothetical protein
MELVRFRKLLTISSCGRGSGGCVIQSRQRNEKPMFSLIVLRKLSRFYFIFLIYRGKITFKGRIFEILLKINEEKLIFLVVIPLNILRFCFYFMFLIFYCRHDLFFYLSFFFF